MSCLLNKGRNFLKLAIVIHMTQQNIPTPPEMVETLVNSMEAKAKTPPLKLFIQALAGGAFIALGFAFSSIHNLVELTSQWVSLKLLAA